jgi:hypothetical protein
LAGSILTLADAKAKFISLNGPINTASFLESTRYYIGRFDVDFKVTEFLTTGEEWIDSDMKIVPIVLRGEPEFAPADVYNGILDYSVGAGDHPLRVSFFFGVFFLTQRNLVGHV